MALVGTSIASGGVIGNAGVPRQGALTPIAENVNTLVTWPHYRRPRSKRAHENARNGERGA